MTGSRPLRPRHRIPSLSTKFTRHIKSRECPFPLLSHPSLSFRPLTPSPYPSLHERTTNERTTKRNTSTISSTTTIDDLPDAVLIHILSFLPTLDSIKSSLLSRRWRKLWHQVPHVILDFFDFCRPSKTLPQTSHSLASLVDQTLFLRRFFPLRILRLRFHYSDYHRHVIRVTSWIRHAVNCGVLELLLDFGTDDLMMVKNDDDEGYVEDGFCRYSFNLSDVLNSRIGVLELYHCCVKFPMNNKALFDFSGLKSLSLGHVWLKSGSVGVLVSSCRNLEFLALEYITSSKLERFEIDLPKLRELRLGFFGLPNVEEGSLDVCAPNLELLSLVEFYVGRYRVGRVESLVEGRLDFGSRNKDDGECWCDAVVLFMGVKRLRVQNMCFGKDEWLQLLDIGNAPQYSAFSNLRHLELITGYEDCDLVGIAAYLELSPKLESLVLDYRYQIDDSEMLSDDFKSRPLKLNMPCLRLVKMENYRSTDRELFFVELLRISKVVLEMVVAVPSGHGKTTSSTIELWKA